SAIDANRRTGSALYERRTWNQRHHGEWIPNAAAARRGSGLQEWKIVDALRRNDVTQLAAFRFQQRRVRFDRHFFGAVADLERHIDAHDLRSLNRHSLTHVFLET